MKCATPDFEACVAAPPSSSNVTSSPVTVLTTSGPVMNMYELPSTMRTKSVIVGEQLPLRALPLDRPLAPLMRRFLPQPRELLELPLRRLVRRRHRGEPRRFRLPHRKRPEEAGMATDWYMEGPWIKNCNCDPGCPCDFNANPTEGFCEGLVAM